MAVAANHKSRNSKRSAVQRYQANGSHCEVMAVLRCPKPISKVNLVPKPRHNTAFVGFTRVNNQGERDERRALDGENLRRALKKRKEDRDWSGKEGKTMNVSGVGELK
ncbi:hypothetical protein TNCV_2215281 [Trichonephila clavipes]|nr:hypothetical protein TNCV_2215281 [Trichonephila clavipes]